MIDIMKLLSMSKDCKVYLAGSLVIGTLVAICYGDTFEWIYERYISSDSYYSHGFLVPFISLYFVYQQKERLSKIPIKGASIGLIIICSSLIMHIVGMLIYVFSVSGFSIYLLIFGLSLYLFGIQITKAIWFSLFFLIFMFPVPVAIIEIVSFPLKMVAAVGGVGIVRMLGVPVLQEGFNITIPAGTLLVGNPCSGLRSLIAFMALATIFAYVTQVNLTRKISIFMLSIPIALISNIARIPILIFASQKYGLTSAGPDTFIHTGSGIFVFILGCCLLLCAVKVFE
jgi:exosortase